MNPIFSSPLYFIFRNSEEIHGYPNLTYFYLRNDRFRAQNSVPRGGAQEEEAEVIEEEGGAVKWACIGLHIR